MNLSLADREKLVRIVTEEVKQHLARQGRPLPPRPAGDAKARKVVTEAVVRAALKAGEVELKVAPRAVITPSARELAESRGLKLIS